jgi:hypothetical protein
MPVPLAGQTIPSILRIGLGAVLGIALSGPAWSQAQPKVKSEGGKEATKAEPTPSATTETSSVKLNTAPEVFRDPSLRPLLENNFPQLFRGESLSPDFDKQIRTMAERGAPNPQVLQRYVRYQAKQLTDHTNIAAMLDPTGDPTRFKNLEEATSRLAIPLEVANSRKNLSFRRELVRTMLEPSVAPELMKNHLYARVQFMTALAVSAEPQALDFFVQQLNSPDQPAIVKLQAARGITQVLGRGATVDAIDGSTRIRCAKALSDFLRANEDAMWPALDRALEALGATRQESFDPGKGDLEFLITAMSYLANPRVAPEVRARAVWAIGMMRINVNTNVNYPLIASHSGRVAVILAESSLAEYDPDTDNPVLNEPVKYWVSRLVSQVLFGMNGDPAIRDSGIIPLASRILRDEKLKGITAIEQRVLEVGKSSLALIQASGSLRVQEKSNLTRTTAELKALLANNPPETLELLPNGPQFPLPMPPSAEPSK